MNQDNMRKIMIYHRIKEEDHKNQESLIKQEHLSKIKEIEVMIIKVQKRDKDLQKEVI
jgi:hypothetical protein